MLGAGDYALTGFVTGEGATITQTAGSYADRNAGVRAVTAALGASDFTADGGTLLSNYLLPTTAVARRPHRSRRPDGGPERRHQDL